MCGPVEALIAPANGVGVERGVGLVNAKRVALVECKEAGRCYGSVFCGGV